MLQVSHADNANGVAVDSSIELTFSESILEASINAENFSLLDANGQSVSGSFQTIESNVVLITILRWNISETTTSGLEVESQI